MQIFALYMIPYPVVTRSKTKKIKLTNNHEKAINARAIAAFFKIVNHFLYQASSVALNNICNHQTIKKIKVISASSHKT